MLTMFLEGGFAMFVILGLGLVTLALAMHAAARPSKARLDLVRHLSRATLYSALVGLVSAFAAVLHNAPKYTTPDLDLPHIVLQGIGESMGAPILGFTLLSLIAIFTGVAARRLAAGT